MPMSTSFPRTFSAGFPMPGLRTALTVLACCLGLIPTQAQLQRVTVDSDLPSAAAGGISLYSTGNELIREANGSLTVAYARNRAADPTVSPNFVFLARTADAGAHWSYQRTDQFPKVARPDCLLRLPAGGYLLGTTFNTQGFVNRSTNGTDWLPLSADSELGRVFPSSTGTNSHGVVLDIDASGTLHMAYTRTFETSAYPWNIGYRSSKDGGVTWSAETDLTQIPHDFEGQGFGAFYPALTTGPGGKVFVAYSRFYKTNIVANGATNVVHYNVPQLSEFNGTKWLPAQTFGDPSISWFSYPSVAVDGNGHLHTIHVQHPGKLANGRVIYRKLPKGTSTFSDPVLISPDTNNAVNITLSVFETDTVVASWDDEGYDGATLTFRAVYAATSADGFQRNILVSTPGAVGRAPALRNRIGAFSSPEKIDILWVENDPSKDGTTPQDRLMYAELGSTIPRFVIQSVVRSNSGATLRYTGVKGRQYQVESSSNLTAWTPLGAAILSSGTSTAVELTTGTTTGSQFYRISDVTP